MAEVVAIIDGHDTRRHAFSLKDALVNDADKLWRLTPQCVDAMEWFGLTRTKPCVDRQSRARAPITDAARVMAAALAAVVAVDTTAQRVALG